MKRTTRIRTLRGTINLPARGGGDPLNSARRNLILDDGRINVGYKVVEFKVFSNDMTGGALNAFAFQCHLAMGLDITSALPSAADNREIAWACYNTGSGESPSYFDLVDPDHIVVRDLYLILPAADNTIASSISYYIMLEEYEISDQEAIISIIKEESQDVDN
jgi:hypothetical protein